ncbi:hypothetical protein TruAng_003572 [Truncatella angustata]|nr:hypothetical protein TruAng_003572 [Truncatella angustata]
MVVHQRVAPMSRPRKPAGPREEKVDMEAVGNVCYLDRCSPSSWMLLVANTPFLQRTEQLHKLEMKHQQGASRTDLLVKDEDVRRLKLRILTLRDENTTLRDQITQSNDENARLASQCDNLGAQLEAKIEVVRSQEKQLRKQEREFSSLKSELQLMNNANQSSTNILAEKLALGRELAVLKPELEHLRSQLTHQSATLAEKLALERQVNTLEVELANEKKATKRAMQKRESTDRTEDDLRQKLRETEKELNAEKAQRERLEDQLAQEKRTHQLALQDQDSTRELESDLRKKYQDAQKQLRESQEENEQLGEELSAERRQAQKTQKTQQKGSSDEADELRTRLQDCEAKLAASQKEVAKIRNQAQSSVEEADHRSDAFEKKFEKLKAKFRELQDQLKQCQADLKKAQKSKPSISEEIEMKLGRQAFKKRKVDDISKGDFSGITIATPNADDKPRKTVIKKKAVEHSILGEKSTFSITPFLNRAKGLAADDDADEEDEIADTSYIPQQHRTSPAEAVTTAPPAQAETETRDSSSEPTSAAAEQQNEEPSKPQPKARGRPKKILGDAPSAKKNAQQLPKTAMRKVPKVASTLENVVEESQENVPEPTDKAQAVKFNTLPQDTSTSSANTSKTEEVKKKKRKVLGSTKTLFDEDEEAVAPTVVEAASRAPMNGARKRAPIAGDRICPASDVAIVFVVKRRPLLVWHLSKLAVQREKSKIAFLSNKCGKACELRFPGLSSLMKGLVKLGAPLNGGSLRRTASAACGLARCSNYAAPVMMLCANTVRYSSSNSRWKQRQGNDFFAREAKVQGLKSRAAFKLLEMDAKYKFFRKGQTVIDLGYAPGSWSQVALERTKPNGKIVGIDLIPAQPPKGVSTIQGNFLNPAVQNLVKGYLQEYAPKKPSRKAKSEDEMDAPPLTAEDFEALMLGKPSYIDTERAETVDHDEPLEDSGRLVDLTSPLRVGLVPCRATIR